MIDGQEHHCQAFEAPNVGARRPQTIGNGRVGWNADDARSLTYSSQRTEDGRRPHRSSYCHSRTPSVAPLRHRPPGIATRLAIVASCRRVESAQAAMRFPGSRQYGAARRATSRCRMRRRGYCIGVRTEDCKTNAPRTSCDPGAP